MRTVWRRTYQAIRGLAYASGIGGAALAWWAARGGDEARARATALGFALIIAMFILFVLAQALYLAGVLTRPSARPAPPPADRGPESRRTDGPSGH